MSDLAPVERLYDALNANDPRGIMAALDPDFVGVVSAGMPCGVGGRHEGAETMLRQCWGEIFKAYDVALEVDAYRPAGDDHALVTGRYVGTVRSSGARFEAAFAHLVGLGDGRATSLEQFTDTRSWPDP